MKSSIEYEKDKIVNLDDDDDFANPLTTKIVGQVLRDVGIPTNETVMELVSVDVSRCTMCLMNLIWRLLYRSNRCI